MKKKLDKIIFFRYSSPQLPQYPTCGHKTKAYQCSTLTMRDIKSFQDAFYAAKDKIRQDTFILKFCTVQLPKRRRPTNSRHTAKATSVKCFIRNNAKQEVPVCQQAFLKVLHITKHRLTYVMKSFLRTGEAPSEKRGGDRKTAKFEGKQAAVQKFINTFNSIESHYCRSSSRRRYLPSDLSIEKMCKMYNSQCSPEERVKPSYFRMIFNTKYNLSFTTPRTDVCSLCIELAEKIKRCTDEEEKKNLVVEKKIHKLRANAFFELLKEARDDLITLSFDCQKNLVLPKVPDQSAYYSRQMYLHNFTIVQGTSQSKLTKQNVFSYYWTENEFGKGSNEVSSAVFDRLNKIDFDPAVTTVRLMADGCSGQNKNTTLIGMCCKWLSERAPEHVQNIEVIFPVVGHSFLPADRVFGNIEKAIKKLEVITQPETYLELFSKIATIIHLGQNCSVFNWKQTISGVFKPTGTWHFSFKNTKRFLLKKCKTGNVYIRGELYYNNDLQISKSVLKNGRTLHMIDPAIIEIGLQQVNLLKLNDVDKLLTKHFGATWRSLEDLKFYTAILSNEMPEPEQPGQEEGENRLPDVEETEEATCEFIEEVPSILV